MHTVNFVKPDQPRFCEAANDGQTYTGNDKLSILIFWCFVKYHNL